MRNVALLLMALAVLSLSGCSSGEARWEYKVLQCPAEALVPGLPENADRLIPKNFKLSDAFLNPFGLQGWELLGTIPEVETVHPNFGSSEYVTGLQPNVRSYRVTLIFKRPWNGKPAPSVSTSPQPAK